MEDAVWRALREEIDVLGLQASWRDSWNGKLVGFNESQMAMTVAATVHPEDNEAAAAGRV